MNTSSINILIADDDEDDALLIAEALQDNLPSCNCIHTTDGVSTLRYIKTHDTPDLVFLDINMPFKDGITCLKDIHNHNLLPSTPILICSTSQNMRDIKVADEFGATLYIVKPSTFNQFNKIITRAIDLLGEPKTRKTDKSSFVLREPKMFDLYN